MASTKTSGEAVATTLTGSELLRCVQGGSDKQTTINAIVTDKGLATLAGTETFSNKTLVSANLGTPSAINLTNATDAANKRFCTDAEKTKLTGIEALADVTDAANVAAAIQASANKSTLVVADRLPVIDTVSGNVLGYITLAQLLATALSANSGGLAVDASSKFRSKGAIAFSYLYNPSTTAGNPGSTVLRMNSLTLASVTAIYIHPTTLGGRDIDGYIDIWVDGKLFWYANNSTSAAWGIFDVHGVANDNGTWWTVSVTPVMQADGITPIGTMPASGEELLLWYVPKDQGLVEQDVLDMDVARFDINGNLIDKDNNPKSGSPVVADQAALIALDESLLENYVVVCEGLRRSAHISDSSNFVPLNGSYIHALVNSSVRKVVSANNVTWVASNNSGKIRITAQSDAAHGLTSNSVGASLYQSNTPSLWPSTLDGRHHIITAVNDASGQRTVDLATDWVTSMGTAPTFTLVTASIPSLSIPTPILRPDSRFIFETVVAAITGSTTNHIICTFDNDQITDWTYSSTASQAIGFRSGFKNKGSVSVQEGIWGASSNGITGGGARFTGGDTNSGAASTWNVNIKTAVVDIPVEICGYKIVIED